jgi:hypothetical protein
MMRKLRVMHFVTGGFSGATQVAIDLVRASSEKDSAFRVPAGVAQKAPDTP